MNELYKRLLCGSNRDQVLDLAFAGATALDPRVTFTRASNATQFDSAGNLVYAPNNWIRNNTMQGAVAGTPGTLPTNWTVGSAAGLTTNVIGTGTEAGVNYVDIQFVGTPTATAYTLFFDATSQIAALNAQTWSSSLWCKIAAGTITNITSVNNNITYRDSGGVSVQSARTAMSLTSTWTRYAQAGTANIASTAFVQSGLWFTVTVGQAIDITLRIGLPQLEIGPVATAVNPTSGTAYQGPRFDYNPSTLAAQGLLIEEQRTNSIRNNTMQGAVAGTPGTLPTNWTILGGGIGTLTRQVVGTGTSNGINYIDYRVSGTTSTTGFTLSFEQNAQIVAANGQTWASSAWVALIGGSTTNITTMNLTIDGRTAAGSFVGVVNNLNLLGVTPTLTRYTNSGTIANASIERVVLGIAFIFNSGVAIDITLRIGLPQLEQGAFATSVIPTTTTALTRSADVASVNTLSPWFNATEGTLFAEFSSYAANLSRAIVGISDGTNNNRVQFFTSAGASPYTLSFRIVSGGVQTNPSNAGTIAVDAVGKAALAYAVGTNQGAASVNGNTPGTSSPTVAPVGLNVMDLGEGIGVSQLAGHLRRITYYPRRLSNAELQAITA